MTFLNTHWTWQYVAILFFVFWTLFKVVKIYYVQLFQRISYTNCARGLAWAALGTYVFHCIW